MRILFAGSGDIGIPTLEYLVANHQLGGVLTQPDRPAGRHRKLKAPAIKEALHDLDPAVSVIQPESPRSSEVISWAKELAPEVMVTMAYGRILPRELLETPTVACLNVHASLLPRHRGASPIQAAIASGDLTSGVTIMHMAEGLDTGDVLLEKSIRLGRRETAGSLSEKIALLAPIALSEAIELIRLGHAPRFQQDHAAATITAKIGREESFLDWRQPAVVLERKIRSLQPRPAALATLPCDHGESIPVKIHSAIVVRRASGDPGSVLRIDGRGVLIACGEGGLLLGTIQPEGKGVMHSSAFARGRALKIIP